MEAHVPCSSVVNDERFVVVTEDFGGAAEACQTRADSHHPRRLDCSGEHHDEGLVRQRVNGFKKAELGWLRLAGETKLAERKVDLELLPGFAHESLIGRLFRLSKIRISRRHEAQNAPIGHDESLHQTKDPGAGTEELGKGCRVTP